MDNEFKEICAKVFAVIDVKGRGSISRDQIPLALRMLNFNPVDSELEKLLKLEPKELNYKSFYQFVTQKLRMPSMDQQRQDLRDALAVFDTSDTGVIEKDVFVAILTRLGEMRVAEGEAVPWVDFLDRHKDGRLRIAEIEQMFINDEDLRTTLNGNQQWELV